MLQGTFPKLAEGRTTTEQGWYQLAALGITLALSIGGGAISGFVASRFGHVDELFDDLEHFHECDYTEVIAHEEAAHKEQEMKPVAPDSARAQTENNQVV